MTDFPWQSTSFIGALIFVLGSCVGSFINVVAYRLPKMHQPNADTSRFNLAFPQSRCPSCARAIEPWHNLPIVGYLWLKGRSRCCNQPIGIHYLLTELIAGAVSVVVFAYLTSVNGPTATSPSVFLTSLASALGLFWWLIAIVKSSISHPVNVTDLWQSLLWLGLLANLNGQYYPLPEAVGLVFTALTLGALLQHRLTQQQDRNHRLLLGVAAGLAWFGTGFLLPLALFILGVGIAKLVADIGRYASNKTSANTKPQNDQSLVAAAIALSWFLSVCRT